MRIPKPLRSLAPAQRRRLTLLAFVRILATSVGLVVLYYLAPLDLLEELAVPVPASLSVALLVLAGAVAWQVRSITRADYPAVRAVEALSVTTPLFLLLFAAAYFILAQDNPAHFSSHPHSHRHALLRGVDVHHGRFRRYHRDQRGRPPDRHRPDAARSPRPRSWLSTLLRSSPDRREAARHIHRRTLVRPDAPQSASRQRAAWLTTRQRIGVRSAKPGRRGIMVGEWTGLQTAFWLTRLMLFGLSISGARHESTGAST